jgi:DNA polymerase-1
MVKYLIFDTETTGLNIIKDKPFMFQYGLVDEQLKLVESKWFNVNDTVSRDVFHQYLKTIPTIVGHNIKFDVHMAINNGFDIELFHNKNFIDTAVLARLVIDHDTQTDKTFSTALKNLGVRYLGIDSNQDERVLKMELSRLVSEHKTKMKEYFIAQGVWDETQSQTTQTKILNDIYLNWNKVFHLYPQLVKVRKAFIKANPEPTYEQCSNVVTYGLNDIKLTHGLLKLWYPKLVKLDQVETLRRLSNVIMPLVVMERQGLAVDVQQVLNDRAKIVAELDKTKIVDSRTNTELSIGQHAKLKELYEFESGLELNSSDKETRSEIEDLSPAAKAANYIAKLDKYLNTYVRSILDKLTDVNGELRVFTQYNLAGTVTGRLSSDFQQFPKEPITLADGYEVNIRSWFIVPKNEKYMFYFDYSQMELRLQCEWTNIVNGKPDINMARAFSPYKCIQRNGKHYLEEDPTKEWKPTDLHTLTAKNAFPNIDESDSNWNSYRQLGKRTNFAVNYGAAAPKIQQALKVDFPTAQALVNGYKKAFAGVVDFGAWIKRRVYITDNIPNLLLRRYYSRNKHQLQNWLVQGSGADILLLKLREIFNYIKDKPHWKYMITVHDEIGFVCSDINEQQLDKEVKDIQKIMTHTMSAVDIISDVEYTKTKWSEKDEWHGI